MTGARVLEGTCRAVVFSYGGFVSELLSLLPELGSEPVGLVVPSNRPAQAVAGARDAAAGAGLTVLEQPPRSSVVEWLPILASLRPDVALVWSYSMILPPDVLSLPPLGSVNLHGGLLPEYRGGHVLQWAIINGERETGMTMHYLDADIDTGPVIGQERFPIAREDDAGTLSARLVGAGFSLLRRHWGDVVSGSAAGAPQTTTGRYWRLRSEADNEIDWTLPAESVRNLVRALVAPWPGAFTNAGGVRLVVDRAEVLEGTTTEAPGTVLSVEPDRLVVASADVPIAVVAARADGNAVEFTALGLQPGDTLGRTDDPL